MVTFDLSARELAYLFGCVGAMLLQPSLGEQYRPALTRLRDRLAPYVPVDSDVARVLGLAEQTR